MNANINAKAVMECSESEEEYQELCRILVELMDMVGEDESHPLFSILELVAVLADDYERQHVAIDTQITPASTLKYFMDLHDLKQKDFPEIGSQGVLSEILNGKRRLNEGHIQKLSERFHVEPRVFYMGLSSSL